MRDHPVRIRSPGWSATLTRSRENRGPASTDVPGNCRSQPAQVEGDEFDPFLETQAPHHVFRGRHGQAPPR